VKYVSAHSVSLLIRQLKDGDDAALAKLYERYSTAAIARARRRFQQAGLPQLDEDALANDAFWDLHKAVRAGRTPNLDNRKQFLALLATIVACKAVNEIKHARAGIRDVSREQSGSVLMQLVEDDSTQPDQQAALRDCYDSFVQALLDPLRPFAELYLAGLTHKQIALELGVVERTVERKMPLIMARWRELAPRLLNEDAFAVLQDASIHR
jgi:RNA polymerase sigma factor (sigma-70 family)